MQSACIRLALLGLNGRLGHPVTQRAATALQIDSVSAKMALVVLVKPMKQLHVLVNHARHGLIGRYGRRV